MPKDNKLTRAKGKIEETAGWAAGDRRVEAKGKVEAEEGHAPAGDELEETEEDVRAEHGDV